MNIEAIAPGQSGQERTSATDSGAEGIKKARDSARKGLFAADSTDQGKKANQVQPEELLQQIKALTDNGAYSVRFEMHKPTNEMVINLIDQKSGEVIRQIPPKEILGMHEKLNNLRGNLLQTES